jgi:hypothetical protein
MAKWQCIVNCALRCSAEPRSRVTTHDRVTEHSQGHGTMQCSGMVFGVPLEDSLMYLSCQAHSKLDAFSCTLQRSDHWISSLQPDSFEGPTRRFDSSDERVVITFLNMMAPIEVAGMQHKVHMKAFEVLIRPPDRLACTVAWGILGGHSGNGCNVVFVEPVTEQHTVMPMPTAYFALLLDKGRRHRCVAT